MNPFREQEQAVLVSELFYQKYYADNVPRKFIIGINPGRFGAAQTGVPFTDPIRLQELCGIPFEGSTFREVSSVFMYEMMDAFGSLESFYKKFYIHSVCPLGFTKLNALQKQINYNYYDSDDLIDAVYPFIIENLHKQLALGIDTETVICLGTGKNFRFLNKINDKFGFFERIIPLEHPRYIAQYKSKEKTAYIDKYITLLQSI